MFKFIPALCVIGLLMAGPVSAHPRERQIKEAAHEVERQAGHLNKAVNTYFGQNANYWGSGHDKMHEMKLIFEVKRFMTSAALFHQMAHNSRINHTYFGLPAAFRVLEANLKNLHKKVDHITNDRSSYTVFLRFPGLGHLIDDIHQLERQVMAPLRREINRIRQPVVNPGHGNVEADLRISSVTDITSRWSLNSRYRVEGHLTGHINSAYVRVHDTFGGHSNIQFYPQAGDGHFTVSFSEPWNFEKAEIVMTDNHGNTGSELIVLPGRGGHGGHDGHR